MACSRTYRHVLTAQHGGSKAKLPRLSHDEHQEYNSERQRLMLLLCRLNRADSQDQTILTEDKKHNILDGVTPRPALE